MSDFTLFLSKFLIQGTAIASIAPSSRWLSETTVRHIDWTTARTLIELGAGTGPITRVLARRAASDCRVIVIERDQDFARMLRERFADKPHFEIVEGDVRQLATILADRGVRRADHIISGLPVPSFPRELQQSLFQTVARVLDLNGGYHQITEIPWLYWRFYRRHFHEVTFAFEPRNLPPGGAYYCRHVKPGPERP